LGIAQTAEYDRLGWKGGSPSTICSIDKDLLQVPGRHYNWVKGEFYEQTYLSGLRCFYEQCLKGDRTDDIPGIAGIGEVKAKRALAGAETEEEMFEIVRGMWMDDPAFLLAGQLLWVRRKSGELWEFPFECEYTIPDTTQKSQSLNPQPKDQDPLSELGFRESNGVQEHGFLTEDTTMTDSVD
jgi:hypothetical protein